MKKQVYNSREDEILDYLKERILNEKFEEHIESFVNDYEKIYNLQFRTLETKQKRDMEFSKEEKKAIEDLKRLRKGIEILNQVTPKKDEVDLIAIDIILKLVNDYQVLLDDIKDHRIVYIDTPEFEEKFISKDKIREIIKHYNDELEHIKNGEEFENEKPMYYWGKVALEDLLEEN